MSSLGCLVNAVNALSWDASWCDTLAENLYWASCEGFIQSSLLGAINWTSDLHVADRERSVGNGEDNIQPDLLLMLRGNHDSYWSERLANGPVSLNFLRALVQVKLVWTEGSAKGSAVISQKSRQVTGDIDGLRLFISGKRSIEKLSIEGFQIVVVSGFHTLGEGRRFVDAAIDRVRGEISPPYSDQLRISLLEDYRPRRWEVMRSNGLSVTSDLIIIGPL